MKQLGLGLNLSTKKTRKREFLEDMERVVPWAVLVQIVAPYYPKAKTGRPPFGVETMLRIHYLQQWFGLSDPAMEEALHDVPSSTKNLEGERDPEMKQTRKGNNWYFGVSARPAAGSRGAGTASEAAPTDHRTDRIESFGTAPSSRHVKPHRAARCADLP